MVPDAGWAVERGKATGVRMSTQGLSTLSLRFYLFERRGFEANILSYPG